jgi:hypothetical protein
MEIQPTEVERRQHRRAVSNTTAHVKTTRSLIKYAVRNLSVGGALLTDGPPLPAGTLVEVVIHVPLYPEIRVKARVVHRVDTLDGDKCTGIAFLHQNDVTEDHIQAALLSELERGRKRV